MPTNKTQSTLLAAILVLCAASGARAQVFQPFAPMEFDYDFQLFAPVELGDFGRLPKPNVGLFAAYDRIHLNVSRPKNSLIDPWDGDFAWGNRYELGYMTDDKNGWLFTAWNLGSPASQFIERFPRQFPEVATPTDIMTVPPPDGEPTENVPAETIDEFLTQLDGHNTLNDNRTLSLELNKTFRLPTLHRGLVIEPFGGVRYVQFIDHYQSDDLTVHDPAFFNNRSPNMMFEGIFDTIPPELVPFVIVIQRQVDKLSTIISTENNMLGGQLGTRLTYERGRWLLTTEVRGFGMHNFVSAHKVTVNSKVVLVETKQIRPIPPEDENDPNQIQPTEDITQRFVGAITDERFEGSESLHVNNTIFGGELRVEAAYKITRDFSLRVGFEALALDRGIGRGQFSFDENVQMFGATFGCQFNR